MNSTLVFVYLSNFVHPCPLFSRNVALTNQKDEETNARKIIQENAYETQPCTHTHETNPRRFVNLGCIGSPAGSSLNIEE
jgi:hypothetical protein